MNLDLTEEETAQLLRELDNIIAADKYFLSHHDIEVPEQDPVRTGAQTAVAEILRTAAYRRERAPDR